MGNKQPEKVKPDFNTIIFQMKMSAKRFERESRKAQKEKEKNLKKAEKCLLKGDESGARLYTGNAQNNINDYKKYLTMSSKLDAMSGKIKSNHNSAEIMKHISNDVTPQLVKEADSMDLKSLVQNFDTFQDAFDKMSVNANIMGQNFNQMTSDGNTVQHTDDLFNQLKNKVQFNMQKDMDGVPVELNQTKQTEQTTQKDDAMNAYMEDLKKF